MQDREILIEEYRSLRSEIMKRQDSRLLLVGFSITAIAALLGILLKDNPPMAGSFFAPLSLVGGVFLIIIITLLLTLQQTQQIDILFKNLKISEILSSYLGKFTDDLSDTEVKARRYLALYYFILSIIMVLIAWLMSLFTSFFNSIFVIILFSIIIILFIYNISKRIHGTDFYLVYLIDMLANDEDENIRRRSARALGNLDNRNSVKPLLDSLFDSKETVRNETESSLIKRGYLDVELIIQCLNENFQKLHATDYDYRSSKVSLNEIVGRLVNILGEIGDARAIDPLLEVSPYETEKVVKALGKIKDNKAIPPLIKALKSDSWVTRKYAAIALGESGSKDAIDPLIDLLNDKNVEIRNSSMRSLAYLGRDEPKVLEALLRQLNNENPSIVMASVEALRILGDEKAVPHLEKLLERFNGERSYVEIKQAISHINYIQTEKEMYNIYSKSESLK